MPLAVMVLHGWSHVTQQRGEQTCSDRCCGAWSWGSHALEELERLEHRNPPWHTAGGCSGWGNAATPTKSIPKTLPLPSALLQEPWGRSLR